MKMKKFMNDPKTLTRECLEGLAAVHSELIHLEGDALVVSNGLDHANRVTVVSQLGSGHEPAMGGFVGQGMLDVAIMGDAFAAPSPFACVDGLKRAERGKGVLYVVLNHSGDILSSNLAMNAMRREPDVHVRKVVVQEDVAVVPRVFAQDRRGMVGGVFACKIAGAAASQGRPLDEVAKVTQRFADDCAAIAVATRSATHPLTGREITIIDEDEMLVGMGIHGEGGGRYYPFLCANDTVGIMLPKLIEDLGIQPGENVMLAVDGSGASTIMELFVVYRAAAEYLAQKGINVVARYVGELLTTQEQAGFQIFMARMDDELLELWNAPCNTPYFKRL